MVAATRKSAFFTIKLQTNAAERQFSLTLSSATFCVEIVVVLLFPTSRPFPLIPVFRNSFLECHLVSQHVVDWGEVIIFTAASVGNVVPVKQVVDSQKNVAVLGHGIIDI